MKPFLGTDLTEDRENESLNGDEFVVATVSEEQARNLERASMDVEDVLKKARLPLPARIVQWLCGLVAIAGIIGLGDDDVNLAQVYQHAAWIFWVCGGCLLVWILLTVIGYRKQDATLKSNDRVLSKVDEAADGVHAELGVPADSLPVDILTFFYKLKDGEPVVKEPPFSSVPYFNEEVSLFVQDGRLCIANFEKKWAFPLSELRAIRTIRKSIVALGWNKEEEPGKGQYKPYKVRVDDNGCIHFKPYHILELEHEGERWGIYFPCYELPAFEALTGLTAE